MLLREALRQARQALAPRSEAPAVEARVLLSDVLGRSVSWVLAHDEALLEEAERCAFELHLERRLRGEPLPYILGRWEFYGRSFEVTPGVLIPRPETELLVEVALHELRSRRGPQRIFDVGTGSGCIAVTLAAELPGQVVFAGDVSLPALRVARRNARGHAVENRVFLVQTRLLDGLGGGWDLICANLPYLPTGRLASLPVAEWEPKVALDGGVTGAAVTEQLAASLGRWLAQDGVALIEIDDGQSQGLIDNGSAAVPDSSFEVRRDLNGLERLLVVRRAAPG